jgi:regulator of protease activity HflC (stomatin/prohibitin superfamily)
MTVLFIVALLLTVGGLIAVFAARGGAKAAGAIVAVVGVILVIATTTTTVGARALGIQTSMGRFHGTMTSGFHWKAPWSDVEEWSTRNQTLRFEAAGGKEKDRDNYIFEAQLVPKLGNQSDAYVEATFTWTIATADYTRQQAKIKALWQQYKTFGDMRDDFITPTVKAAVSDAFDGYDPLSGIKPVQVSLAQPTTDNPGFVPNAEWSTKVFNELAPQLGARGIDLVTVHVTRVDFDDITKQKLRDYNVEVVNTRIAAQRVETAKKEAQATAERSNKDKVQPGCESLIRDLAAQGQLQNVAPGNLKCSDDGSANTPVIVDGTRR